MSEEEIIHNDEIKAWHRQPFEIKKTGHRRWEAFKIWLYTPGHGMKQVYQTFRERISPELAASERGDVPSWFKKWRKSGQWDFRLSKYEEELDRIREENAKAEAAKDGTLWVDRERELREKQYKLSMQLHDRAIEIMNLPLTQVERTYEKKSPDGKTIHQTVIIKPISVKGSDPAALAMASNRLGQLAVGKPTSHVKTETDPIVESVENLAEEKLDQRLAELERILTGTDQRKPLH